MAEEKMELRDVNVRQLLPWTEIFRGFQVALDPKKLLLAAAGLVVMAAGWWLLAVIFMSSRDRPDFGSGQYKDFAVFKEKRQEYNLLYKAAGNGTEVTDPGDLAANRPEYDLIKPRYDQIDKQTLTQIANGQLDSYPLTFPERVSNEGKETEVTRTVVVRRKPFGEMRTMPWAEDRGPNPYLLVTGQEPGSTESTPPWQRGQLVNWLATNQFPVLIEPLRKFLRPIIFLFQRKAGFWNCLYFCLDLLWVLATWAFFGGAITRMAAVQLARKEKLSMSDALRFTAQHYLSYFSAPLFPLVFLLVIVIALIIYGFLHMIPAFGDIVVDGLGWPLVLLAGIVMAVILVGLVGWSLMYATISAEGSDSFDALSRSYSYVYQAPWHYLWYSIVAILYGAVLVFFVGFMGSLMVYLGKWGVTQTPFIDATNRDPSYLFVYAPQSFNWRTLLLEGAKVKDGPLVVQHGAIDPAAYNLYTQPWDDTAKRGMHWWNYVGAWLVTVWLGLIFLLVVGFGYSYFWSASTIIYLLMRRRVDDTELDEVYLEEDEGEEMPRAPVTPTPATATTGGNVPLTMVEPPTLKTPPPPPPSPPPAPAVVASPKVESLPPAGGDGNPPA